MATTVATVDGDMIESLRKAINDCADRGLQNASKWYVWRNHVTHLSPRSNARTPGGPQSSSQPCRPQSVALAKTPRSHCQCPRGAAPLVLLLYRRCPSLRLTRMPPLPAPWIRACRPRSSHSSSTKKTSSPQAWPTFTAVSLRGRRTP